VSEMMGSSVHLHVSAEGKDVIIIVPTIEMKGDYAMGSALSFSFDGAVAHVFSKETERNLEW
ncbi:MAG: ABC transporter ATP-binding protein, partial [Clostridia bacterium]|nr:ABC transporter ATP-binding protein [Clostridia bacterium]